MRAFTKWLIKQRDRKSLPGQWPIEDLAEDVANDRDWPGYSRAPGAFLRYLRGSSDSAECFMAAWLEFHSQKKLHRLTILRFALYSGAVGRDYYDGQPDWPYFENRSPWYWLDYAAWIDKLKSQYSEASQLVLRKGIRASISPKLRFQIFLRDNFQCRYCGQRPPEVILELDHIIPIALGGTSKADNLAAACFDCNRGKSDSLTS